MAWRGVLALLSAATLFGAAACDPRLILFKDHRVVDGSAYGFTIGATIEDTLSHALALQRRGDFVEFKLGEGSAAELLDPESPDRALKSDSWQLVVDPTWWNNAIYLSFERQRLHEIWRLRLCCELP